MNGHLLYTWIDVQFSPLDTASRSRGISGLRFMAFPYIVWVALQVAANAREATIHDSCPRYLGLAIFYGWIDTRQRSWKDTDFPVEIEHVDADSSANKDKTVPPTFRRLAPLTDGWKTVESPTPLATRVQESPHFTHSREELVGLHISSHFASALLPRDSREGYGCLTLILRHQA